VSPLFVIRNQAVEEIEDQFLEDLADLGVGFPIGRIRNRVGFVQAALGRQGSRIRTAIATSYTGCFGLEPAGRVSAISPRPTHCLVMSCGSRRKNLQQPHPFSPDEVVKAFEAWADTIGRTAARSSSRAMTRMKGGAKNTDAIGRDC
jgi:hypothetical protein